MTVIHKGKNSLYLVNNQGGKKPSLMEVSVLGQLGETKNSKISNKTQLKISPTWCELFGRGVWGPTERLLELLGTRGKTLQDLITALRSIDVGRTDVVNGISTKWPSA